jgi:hypothetical protein
MGSCRQPRNLQLHCQWKCPAMCQSCVGGKGTWTQGVPSQSKLHESICGYFPLHEAAERFSVGMIKLLFKYGASANVRTAGNEIIENLLPLHVAIENTCLHKYLEDNLPPFQDSLDHRYYVYKLIQLLCLPEMVIHFPLSKMYYFCGMATHSSYGHVIITNHLFIYIN